MYRRIFLPLTCNERLCTLCLSLTDFLFHVFQMSTTAYASAFIKISCHRYDISQVHSQSNNRQAITAIPDSILWMLMDLIYFRCHAHISSAIRRLLRLPAARV